MGTLTGLDMDQRRTQLEELLRHWYESYCTLILMERDGPLPMHPLSEIVLVSTVQVLRWQSN